MLGRRQHPAAQDAHAVTSPLRSAGTVDAQLPAPTVHARLRSCPAPDAAAAGAGDPPRAGRRQPH
jgi:hypothetical protein